MHENIKQIQNKSISLCVLQNYKFCVLNSKSHNTSQGKPVHAN